MMKPAIVIAGYNRPTSIRRLFGSVAAAKIPRNTTLVISLDGGGGNEVRKLARSLEWPHGEKRIVDHQTNLGLRRHILSCGDLTREYESVILLEDDLFVSPYFYSFAQKALSHYRDDDRVSGISLYDHRTNGLAGLPFMPLQDGFDTYFMQIASSWGQAWTDSQWELFREWYDHGQEVSPTDALPANVKGWSESSWKKYYIKYLALTDRFFVYPHVGYSTNCSDLGTHAPSSSTIWQVRLAEGMQDQRFPTLDESKSIYDSFFEMSSNQVKRIAPNLADYDFTVDFYGRKEKAHINTPFVLTSKACHSSIFEYRLKLKPMELNLRDPLLGADAVGQIRFCRTEDISGAVPLEIVDIPTMQYFHGPFPLRKLAMRRIKDRLFGK